MLQRGALEQHPVGDRRLADVVQEPGDARPQHGLVRELGLLCERRGHRRDERRVLLAGPWRADADTSRASAIRSASGPSSESSSAWTSWYSRTRLRPPLGGVQRAVGGVDDAVGRPRHLTVEGRAGGCRAHRDGDRDPAPGGADAPAGDGLADPLGDLEQLVAVAHARQEAGELLPAPAGHGVVRPHRALEPAGELDQDVVAGRWPNVSLIRLKWSASIRSRPSVLRSRVARASSRASTSRKWRRL